MKSIIYICPANKNKPTGGIKIIYRHVEILSKLLSKKVDSKIFHFEDFNFKCDWFPHNVDFKKNSTFNSIKEFVIIPEWMAVYHAKILQKANVKYGIFVQNGFYLHTKPKNNFSDKEINEAYALMIQRFDSSAENFSYALQPSLKERIALVQEA